MAFLGLLHCGRRPSDEKTAEKAAEKAAMDAKPALVLIIRIYLGRTSLVVNLWLDDTEEFCVKSENWGMPR